MSDQRTATKYHASRPTRNDETIAVLGRTQGFVRGERDCPRSAPPQELSDKRHIIFIRRIGIRRISLVGIPGLCAGPDSCRVARSG